MKTRRYPMITYHCDGCGKELAKNALRYSLRIEVKAAYDTVEVGLMDLVRSHREDMLALIEKMKHKDPRELEQSVYTHFDLDLCPACQRTFISAPLKFSPNRHQSPGDFDVDAFLRSLGYGKGDEETPQED
jgi:rRNA maturation protein Nop10